MFQEQVPFFKSQYTAFRLVYQITQFAQKQQDRAMVIVMPRGKPSSGGEAFARRITELMAREGKTQAQVAEELGVWDSVVLRWRRGGGISVDNVRKLADLFGVERSSLEELAGYATAPTPPGGPVSPDVQECLDFGNWYGQLVSQHIPHARRRAYALACESLVAVFAADPDEFGRDKSKEVQQARRRYQRQSLAVQIAEYGLLTTIVPTVLAAGVG